MNQPPVASTYRPPPARPPGEDLQHLRLLSTFHYVLAGVMALFSLFPVLHLVVGVGLATGSFPDTQGDEEARIVGTIFIVVAVAGILFGFFCAALVALAGKYLKERRNYVFCLVVAGLSCLFMPFGTVLGVFTIVVLMRDSVKHLFGRPVTAPPAPS
jgi:MFS family permease